MKAFAIISILVLAHHVQALLCNYENITFPICKYANAWSYENGTVCVGITRCISQSPPFGIYRQECPTGCIPRTTSSPPVTTSLPPVTTPSPPPVTTNPQTTMPPTTTAKPPSNGNIIWSLDFENEVVGSQPAGWSNYIGWQVNNQNSKSGSDYAVVDTGRARSGTKSLHIKCGANGPAQIVKRLPQEPNAIYARMWMYTSHVMGNIKNENHEHFTGVKAYEGGADASSFSAYDETRVGSGKGHLGYNHAPSDAISPAYEFWGTGASTPANKWYCVETAYIKDPTYNKLHMYVDGQLVNSVDKASDWHTGQPGLPANWLEKQMGYMFFGWHSFSQNAAEIWMDDIVVATYRVGCE